jgi:glycosyltransferase 2 family protein
VTAKTALWRVVQLALVVLITWGIVRTLAPDLAKVSIDDFRELDPSVSLLVIATIALLAFYLMHAWLWRAITAHLGEREFDYRTALHIYFVSGLGRYIPGKLWQVAGMALLAQRAGISAVAATAASVIAQFAFITAGLLYLALVLPRWGGITPIIAAVATLAIVIATYRGRHWIGGKIKKVQPAADMLDRVTVSRAFTWWLGYGLSWILLGLAFVLFTSAFVRLDAAGTRHVAGAIAAAYLGGLLAFFSIAGLGVREAVLGSLLLPVMPAPAAVIISVASRVWFTIGELLPIAFGKHRTEDNARPGHNPDV